MNNTTPEIENNFERDTEFELLRQKASYLDSLLPGFFDYAIDSYYKYLEREIEKAKCDSENTERPSPFCSYVSNTWLELMKANYDAQLRHIDLDDIYYIDMLTSFYFCREYLKAGQEMYSPQKASFLMLFENSSDYFDEFFHFVEDEDEKLEEEERWTFRDDDIIYQVIPDDAEYVCIVKDTTEDVRLIDTYYDYRDKKNTLFNVITNPDISLRKRRKWAADFVCLSELIIRGEYKWGTNTLILKDLKNSGSFIDIIHPEEFISEVRSFKSCFLYFFNYLEHRTEANFLAFVRLSYLTCTNIYDQAKIEETVFEMTEIELLQILYEYALRILEECRRENTYGITINCLPKDTEPIYSLFFPKHIDFSKRYYDEAISPYVNVLTQKDLNCRKLAELLIENGYGRKDFEEYIAHYYENLSEEKKYLIIYNKIYELALIQEILYLVSDGISLNSVLSLDIPNIKRLCNRIQDYVYQDYGFSRVERELESKNSKSIELMSLRAESALYRNYLYLLNVELNSGKSFSELADYRKSLFTRIFNEGIGDMSAELLAEINSKMLSHIESMEEQDSQYETVSAQVSKVTEQYIPSIRKKIYSYLGQNTGIVDTTFESIRRKLTTAELLYRRYIQPYSSVQDATCLPDEVREMDYRFIALEYYSALEQLANILLYYPYKEKILKPAFDEYGCDLFKYDKKPGYVGRMNESAALTGRDSNKSLKESLELGPISFLYRRSIDKRKKIKKEFSEVDKYLKAMSLSIKDASRFGEDLFKIKDLRNESAHGSNNLDINRAKKAQDVSYIHLPNRDQVCQICIADECHEEIIKLLKWFSE